MIKVRIRRKGNREEETKINKRQTEVRKWDREKKILRTF